MAIARRTLGRIAALLLLCYACAPVVTPAAQILGVNESANSCLCDSASPELCPMHHAPAGAKKCAVRSTQSDGSTAVLMVLGPVGLVAASVRAVAPPLVSAFRPVGNFSPSSPAFDPDAPPPRL